MRIPSSRFLINRSIIKKNTCSVPTRAFNLGTRAFSLLTRGFELVTRAFELVTRRFELVTRVLIFHDMSIDQKRNNSLLSLKFRSLNIMKMESHFQNNCYLKI